MQSIVFAVSILGMLIIAYAFAQAVRQSGADNKPPSNPETRRKSIFWGLTILGVLVSAASLASWPHDTGSATDKVTINVSGAQWYWEIDNTEVPVGREVVFNVHSQDVNHGMGVVDPDGKILFQTQSMPGYVNKVKYVFNKPGTYRILCMEFCGVAHHDMVDEFQVVSR